MQDHEATQYTIHNTDAGSQGRGAEESCQKQNSPMDYKRGETEVSWGETGAEMDFWIGVPSPSSQFWRISPSTPLRKG